MAGCGDSTAARAHPRPTNFYEVDLVEALTASGDTDPNEAFRYWSLFFRPDAFRPSAEGPGCWLDAILQGSREYAKRLGERLKDRIFLTIFPHLAQGFLVDRKQRLTPASRGVSAPGAPNRGRTVRHLRGHPHPAVPAALLALRRE